MRYAKPNLSKTAIRKLRQVQKQILAEPELYNQRAFADMLHPCTGACCISGWLVWNENPTLFKRLAARNLGQIPKEAQKILGIGFHQGLFGGGGSWPHALRNALIYAKTPQEYAEAGAAAIEDFIQKDGRW